MKIYNEKDKAGQSKLQNVNFEKKRAPGSGIDLNSLYKDINGLRNGMQGVVTSGHDSTQLNFQLVQRD